MTNKIKKIICTSIFVYFIRLQSVISLSINNNNNQDVQQVVLPNDADPPTSFTNLKDSYGNPLTLSHKNSNIENNGRSRVIEANGYLFQIPSYASGITNIEPPSDKLVPPLVSDEELHNAENLQLYLDLLPPFLTNNKDSSKSKQDATSSVKTKPKEKSETREHFNSSESKKDNNNEVRNTKTSEFNKHTITEHEEYSTKHITADLFPTKNKPYLLNNILNENFFDSTSTEAVLTTITDLNTPSINENFSQDLSKTTTDIISTTYETNDESLYTVTSNTQSPSLLENNITFQDLTTIGLKELLTEYTHNTEKHISSESTIELPSSKVDSFQNLSRKLQSTFNNEFISTTDSLNNGILKTVNHTLFSTPEEVTIKSHIFSSNTTFSNNEDSKLNTEHETTTQQIFLNSEIPNSQLMRDENFVVTDKEISLPLSGMTTPLQFTETDKKQFNEKLETSSQFLNLYDKTTSATKLPSNKFGEELITEIPLFSLKTTISEVNERDDQITSSTFPPKKFTANTPPSEDNVLELVTELLPPLEEITTQPTPSALQTNSAVNCNLGHKCKPDCFISHDCKSIQDQDTAQIVQATQIPLIPQYTVFHFDLSTPKQILSMPDFIQKNPFLNKLPIFSDSKNVQLHSTKPFPLIFQQNAFPFTDNQEKQNEQENYTPLTVNRISNSADINHSVTNNNKTSISQAKTSQNYADSQGPFLQKPEKHQFKYTGGFGGIPGVLGDQELPGYAIQADGTIKDPDHQYQPDKMFQSSTISPTNQFSQQLSSSTEENIDKYKGGFGGPPGLLIPYDNK